jgi:O-antigen ligase
MGQAAISLVSFFIIFLTIIDFKKVKFILKKNLNFDYVLIIFFLYIVLSSSFKSLSIFINSLYLTRFLLLYFSIKYLILNLSLKDFRIFLKIIFFCSIFVIIDLFYQKYFGLDFFGFGAPLGNELRLTGPFKNEPIPGSYLLNIGFYSIVFLYMFFFKAKVYNKNLVIISTILIFALAIFLTGERMSFLMFIFLNCIIFVFFTKIRKQIFFSFILILISISVISYSNNYYKDRIFNFSYNIGIYKDYNKSDNNMTFLDSQWGAHLLTSYEMFRNNPLTGVGVRQFRVQCSENDYAKINSKSKDIRCSTHPHNLYFEILSETGLVGLFLFTIFLFLVSVHFIKIFKSSKKYYICILSVYTFCVFLMLFWPIRSTGSFFSNFNGSVYWLIISLLSGLLFKQDLKNNNNC